MLKPIFLSLMVLLAMNASKGQSFKLVNKTASDNNSKILYIGLDNYLEVKDETFTGIEPQDNVTLQQNILAIRPARPGQLTVTFLTTKGKVPVTFSVKYVSDAIVVIGGQTGKVMSKDGLLTKPWLSLEQADDRDTLFDHYKVISFTAQLNGHTVEITGRDFSNGLLTAIRNAQKGDILGISAVKGLNEALGMTTKFNKTNSFELE